jgi:hypothetical protein
VITISTNVAIGAGSILVFAGFMLGYSIAWWQRGRYDAHSLAEVLQSVPEPTTLVVGDLETRFRRSQG